MNDNSYLSGVIRDQLEAHSPVVLASLVSMEGSSPRETGTKMIVAANGRSYGTIGGGVLEAAVTVRSKRVLQDATSKLVEFDMDDSGGATEGMICGGKVEVLLDLIAPTEGNLELFEEMHDSIARGENLYFVTAFEGFPTSGARR